MIKKKIAFVTPSLALGGRERVLSLIINHFIEKGEVEVHLILYGKSREVKFQLNNGIIIHKPNFDYSAHSSFISLLKTLYFVRTTVKRLGIDIMVSFEEIWNRFALLATVGIGIRKVISNRNNPYRQYGMIDNILAKLLYPTVDILIAQTQIAKNVYTKKYTLKKCVVIGNPIESVENVNDTYREKIIITVGRLMASKNHLRLLSIFSKINRSDWRLMIVGGDFADHDIKSKLKKKILEYGLEGRVILTGSVTNINELLLKSSIFAFASSKEGFPNAVGEAMAAGVPVISYDCVAGPSEMIVDGVNGFLIPMFDDERFVDKLNFLIKNDAVRTMMGKNAMGSIKKFGSEKICEEFYNIILKEENDNQQN